MKISRTGLFARPIASPGGQPSRFAHRVAAGTLLLLLAMTAQASPWQKPGSKKPAPKAAAAKQGPPADQKNETEAEAPPLPRYSAVGKRDPFQNLANLQVKPSAPKIIAPPPLSSRPPGLAGLLISEISIIGFANKGDKKIAVLRGTDKFTYMAREGTKLYDGVLETINGEELTFAREIRDTAGNTMTSKVVKR